MNLNKLIAMASSAYPDGLILEIFDPKTKHAKKRYGDGLAAFVVNELSETFDSNVSTMDQLLEAQRAIGNAARELENVSDALNKYLLISELEDKELPLYINNADPFVRELVRERLKK